MDAVSHYLNSILAPRLRGYGVSEHFLLRTIGIIHTQMTSLLRHWDDRVFKNTVLLLGLEEGSFYEPRAKIDIRCFVVVAIRNMTNVLTAFSCQRTFVIFLFAK